MPHAGRPVLNPDAPTPSAHGAAPAQPEPRPKHFIEQIVDADNASGRWGTWPVEDAARAGKPRVHTRFPPEPNGYLHIGHAKSICLNHGLARDYHGKFNLRFDDTNPAKEEQEYVDSIIRDVLWLGADFQANGEGGFGGGLCYASDYFGTMYAFAEELIRKGKAYVCELSADEVSKRRGTPSVPATSPFRDRPAEESLRLLAEMKAGKHPNGAMTLRAKIDLASPNFNLRDPVMYRILHESHQHTGTTWCIYPMYDWAHGFEDSIEGITHSICTLEFENHRPLYDWFINAVNEGRDAASRIHHPQQIEFAKLRFTYVVLSKRNLLRMVEEKIVNGWDDPRMPTIAGYRRRGYHPASIRAFMEEVGVTRIESWIDVTRLENAARDYWNKHAPRTMCVLRPLRVVIDNWPRNADGTPVVEMLDFVVNPETAARADSPLPEGGAGGGLSPSTRKIPFSGELFIEREDFMEVPPKKFFRLSPGTEVRLRWAYFIKCVGFEKDAAGNVTAVHCTYDPATRGGDAPPGPNGEPPRKVKATLHWISAAHAVTGEVRLFDRLFKAEEPGAAGADGAKRDFVEDLNPNSLEVITDAKLDPHLRDAAQLRTITRSIVEHGVTHTIPIPQPDVFQFERLGYFAIDRDSTPDKLVFNRTVTLKDNWAKEAAKQ